MARRKARRPRNTEPAPGQLDVEKTFLEIFPAVDLEALLADPAERTQTRRLDALLAKKLLVTTAAHAFRGGTDGGPSLFWLQKLPQAIKLDAEIAGNLGERVVEVPEDPVARLCGMMGLDRQQFYQLVASLESPKREEKVIEGECEVEPSD